MKKKIGAGLIVIAAITMVAMFAGCLEKNSFDVEYPATAYLSLEPTSFQKDYYGVTEIKMQITLYNDGTASGFETFSYRNQNPKTNQFKEKWTIKKETTTSIEYTTDSLSITLLSNHDALGRWTTLKGDTSVYNGHWLTGS